MAQSTKERVRAHREKSLSPSAKVVLRTKRLLQAFPQFSGRLEKVLDGYLSEIPPKLREKV